MAPRGRSDHVTLRLARLEDLFHQPQPQLFASSGRLISGIEELVLALEGRRLPRRVSTTIVLEGEAPPAEEAKVASLLRRYCEVRLRELELRIRSQRRELNRALLIGLLLFVVGIALNGEFTSQGWPGEIRSILGEGVFLVVAWVGLWYPLDALIFSRRPLLLERDVLRRLMESQVTLERAREAVPD